MTGSLDRPNAVIAPFTTEHPTKITFGEGRLEDLAADARRLAGLRPRILLVADRGVLRAGLVERAQAALAKRRLEPAVWAELDGEPRAADVDAAATAARAADAQLVIALGGGSALDVGKLAAAIAPAQAPAETYALAARALPSDPLPVLCVPTTAGTGAEVTRTAVFADHAGRKLWAWGEALRPRQALLDPTLTLGLPPPITATAGLDALVHAIEAATNRRGNPFTDASALQAIRLVCQHLATAVHRPDDLSARAGMLIAACLAGLAIDGAGTALAHGLGHALGTIARVPHGRAVALSLRVTLPWNVAAAPRRHRAVAEAMGLHGVEEDEHLAPALAGRYEALLRDVGVAVGLRGDGLGPGDGERVTEALFAPENRPMLEANARAVTRAGAAQLVAELLARR